MGGASRPRRTSSARTVGAGSSSGSARSRERGPRSSLRPPAGGLKLSLRRSVVPRTPHLHGEKARPQVEGAEAAACSPDEPGEHVHQRGPVGAPVADRRFLLDPGRGGGHGYGLVVFAFRGQAQARGRRAHGVGQGLVVGGDDLAERGETGALQRGFEVGRKVLEGRQRLPAPGTSPRSRGARRGIPAAAPRRKRCARPGARRRGRERRRGPGAGGARPSGPPPWARARVRPGPPGSGRGRPRRPRAAPPDGWLRAGRRSPARSRGRRPRGHRDGRPPAGRARARSRATGRSARPPPSLPRSPPPRRRSARRPPPPGPAPAATGRGSAPPRRRRGPGPRAGWCGASPSRAQDSGGSPQEVRRRSSRGPAGN